MWPWLLIIGLGRRGRIPLPIPLLLLWPFLLLGWLVLGIGCLVKRSWRSSPALAGLYGGLMLYVGARGLRVDARPHEGPGVRIWVI